MVFLGLVSIEGHGVHSEEASIGDGLRLRDSETLRVLVFLACHVLGDALFAQGLIEEHDDRLREVLLTQVSAALLGLALLRLRLRILFFLGATLGLVLLLGAGLRHGRLLLCPALGLVLGTRLRLLLRGISFLAVFLVLVLWQVYLAAQLAHDVLEACRASVSAGLEQVSAALLDHRHEKAFELAFVHVLQVVHVGKRILRGVADHLRGHAALDGLLELATAILVLLVVLLAAAPLALAAAAAFSAFSFSAAAFSCGCLE